MVTKSSTYLPRLPKLDWVQGIRDPIWGEIGITEVEKKIIQTETFSRLRGIKQLSFAYLAFPGAVHSRFEHSIGVMHMTDQLLKSVKNEEPHIEMGSEHRQLLRLAALLHDIGHPPFSHAMENLFSYYPEIWREVKEGLPTDFKDFMVSRKKDYGAPREHEDFTDYLICTDPAIQRVLKDWVKTTNDDSFMKMEEEQQVAFIKDVVAKLAIGEEVTSQAVSDTYRKLGKIFKGVMSGDIDADKIDYLARDNYYCGLPYELDITSLREQLIVDNGELTLLPNGIKFVNTVILARYWLITEVHQNIWDTFTTDKAVELLNRKLKEAPERAELIFEIFTKWQDSNLVEFLVKSNDENIRKILTTEYDIKEIGQLDYLEAHPYVRVAMQVLSETENHHHIPKLQEDLRKEIGRDDLFIHINRVKSPSFAMKVKGGNLLRNEILRGISEESLKNFRIVIYGENNHTTKINPNVSFIPEQSEQIDDYLENLGKDELKKLIAYLVIRRYRKICEECSEQKLILASDFLLLVMEIISDILRKRNSNSQGPTRQIIYQVARLIQKAIHEDEIKIRGDINLKDNEITPSFHREIRKHEQIGLISYSRRIDQLKREDMTDDFEVNPVVFRFDRRFTLSTYGIKKLNKIRDLRTAVPEYSEYLKIWDIITSSAEKNLLGIERIIAENSQ